MFRVLLAVAAAAVGTAPPPAVAQASDSLRIEAVRFYRPTLGRTLVKAFIEVPYTGLTARPAGDSLAYTVSLRVTDSTGLELTRQSWGKTVPAGFVQSGARGLDILEFALAPGSYRMTVDVAGPDGRTAMSRELDLRGWAETPDASDLLLAPAMRMAADSDTVPQPGEVRQGNYLITGTADLQLTPLRAKAYYLLEAYNPTDQEQAGTVSLTVIDSTGAEVTRTPGNPVRVAGGGGMLHGSLDLAGLPGGRYMLRLELDVNGTTVVREDGFGMADLQSTMERQVAVQQANRVTDEGYFAAMNAAQLDSAFEPLDYIAGSGELRPYEGLSLDGKRRFMATFWQERDPTPETAVNEARLQFYGALAYADEHYGEAGRAGRPGWKTDRGRVFAKLGAPDDVYQRQQEGRAPPYLIWRYTRGRGYWYIFADQTGLGHFVLIHTNDGGENKMPNWREVIGQDAVTDAGRFLGVSFYDPDTASGL